MTARPEQPEQSDYLAGYLSDVEHRAIALTAELTNLVIGTIIGDGPTRSQDCAEFVAKVHDIQHLIMGQAAARAYPDLYRTLGGVL